MDSELLGMISHGGKTLRQTHGQLNSLHPLLQLVKDSIVIWETLHHIAD